MMNAPLLLVTSLLGIWGPDCGLLSTKRVTSASATGFPRYVTKSNRGYHHEAAKRGTRLE